jgi:nitrogen-specific signal transduction histidine kinase
MSEQESTELRKQVDNLKSGIREITHDISNPLGVIRMAAYYLQVGKMDDEKRSHYFTVIGQTIDKVELQLRRLRELGQNPSLELKPIPPSEKTAENP